MATMTLRLKDTDAELIRKYAQFYGMNISEFIRDAVFEKIEDEQDLADLNRAIEQDNGIRYSHKEVLDTLGLEWPIQSLIPRVL